MDIFQIGKESAISFFGGFVNAWEPDLDEAALELARALSDKQLIEAFKNHPGRLYAVFRGANYTFEDGNLTPKGSFEKIRVGIAETEKKYGQRSHRAFEVDGAGRRQFRRQGTEGSCEVEGGCLRCFGQVNAAKSCCAVLRG